MVGEDKEKFVTLLRRAAAQTIPEMEFWAELRALLDRTEDPAVELAWESATHYWGNFHSRSIFFLIPLKPDRGQLVQGRNELNLIADGVESGWELPVLKKKLKDI